MPDTHSASIEYATKTDLDVLRNALRGDLATLRAELKGDMQEVRAEMRELRLEVRVHLADMKAEFSELKAALLKQQAWMLIGMTGVFGTLVTVLKLFG